MVLNAGIENGKRLFKYGDNMKYLILIILLCGCSVAEVRPEWMDYPFPKPDIDLTSFYKAYNMQYKDEYFFKYTEISISNRTNYIKDHKEKWQTPDKTWTIQQGDCKDKALLAAYIITAIADIKTELLSVKTLFGWHIIIFIPEENTYLMLSGKEIYKNEKLIIRRRNSYEYIMRLAYYNDGKPVYLE